MWRYQTQVVTGRGCATPSRSTVDSRKLACTARPRATSRRCRNSPRRVAVTRRPSSAGSRVLEQKRDNLLSRSFDPGFRIALHHKDMGIVQAAAREAGLTIPLGALVGQLVAAANAQGDGKLDHSGLFRQIANLNGRD